jgi:hypothetical protein
MAISASRSKPLINALYLHFCDSLKKKATTCSLM